MSLMKMRLFSWLGEFVSCWGFWEANMNALVAMYAVEVVSEGREGMGDIWNDELMKLRGIIAASRLPKPNTQVKATSK